MEDGEPIFENPPPDYNYQTQENEEQQEAKPKVWEYLKKYLVKNLKLVLNKFEDKKAERKALMRLSFYWLFRIPFYTCSPKLRPKTEKPPPSGLIFLFSVRWEDYDEAIQKAKWLIKKWTSEN